jgi:hypothetical protein
MVIPPRYGGMMKIIAKGLIPLIIFTVTGLTDLIPL